MAILAADAETGPGVIGIGRVPVVFGMAGIAFRFQHTEFALHRAPVTAFAVQIGVRPN